MNWLALPLLFLAVAFAVAVACGACICEHIHAMQFGDRPQMRM